jgi:glycosyltransferase involved in cell wall biosynthesis
MGQFQLVHANADYGVAFKASNKPFIVTVHHNVVDESYRQSTTFAQRVYHYGVMRGRLRRALEEADRVIAVSYSTKSSLERNFRAKNVEVIYNGIDTQFFAPKRVAAPARFAGKIRLLFVGNLIKRKGADLLPLIMKRLGNDYVLFYTAGLQSRAAFKAQNMIPCEVKSRCDLVSLYNMCDILLFPSRLEGFGYAVAEAMACCKPVVCTNGSSLPELVIDQRGGLLCKQDNADDFIDKVRALGGNEQLRQTMGKFNRERIVNNFDLAQMGASYARLYQQFV